MKLPKHYFCLNDMTPQHEVEECIIQECESAGLDIREDEDLAEERGYDRAFEVVNPYKNKLNKIKKILKTNMWDIDACLENAKLDLDMDIKQQASKQKG